MIENRSGSDAVGVKSGSSPENVLDDNDPGTSHSSGVIGDLNVVYVV